jgi:hypothetical protein
MIGRHDEPELIVPPRLDDEIRRRERAADDPDIRLPR